jgi:methylenetetrahydrofolate dehydrogenase (NADP+) / methenyltetrahydrofolate cyclohydrolase
VGFTNVRGVPGWTALNREAAGGVLIDGRAVAEALRAETAGEVAARVAAGARAPALATVLVGEDPASHVYVGAKHRACEQAGMRSLDHRLPADVAPDELAALIERLNADDEVDGILLQLPLPAGLDAARFVELIDPRKDVDGLTPTNAGRLWQGRPGLVPCTPRGVVELLDRSGVELAGREAVIVGRSDLVGKPLTALLLARHATVTVCHSRTRDLEAVCRRADVLIAAVGIPGLVGAGHVKPGAVVIDVGITRTEDGLVGDVDFEAVAPRVAAITPVPGGVGPMTIACLLANTLRAAQLRGHEQNARRDRTPG